MKIAVYHNLPEGGALRVLGDQCRLLIERGHKLECWTPVGASTGGLPPQMPVHTVPYAGGWHILHGAVPRLLNQFQKIVCSTGALDDIARRAAEEINRGDFDLLFSGNCRYQAAPPIARHASIPSVLYAHEPYRPFYEKELAMPLLRLNRHRRMREEAANASAFTMLLANSEYSRHRLRTAYGLIARVCYLGVDTGRWRATGAPRGEAMVGVGTVQPHKRIELAIEALARLPETVRPPLIWVGSKGNPLYRFRLLNLARRRHVRLTLCGAVSDVELVSILSRARLLICTARHEPFGLTPLEAGACETPVVGVMEGGLMETVVRDVNGVLAEPVPVALAAEIRELLDHPKQMAALGRRARQHVVQRWSLQGSLTTLENHFIEASMSGRGGQTIVPRADDHR